MVGKPWIGIVIATCVMACTSDVARGRAIEDVYARCIGKAKQAMPGSLLQTYYSDQKKWKSFLDDVASGENSAVLAATSFVMYLDGGELEDISKALGLSIRTALPVFLCGAKINELGPLRCATVLGSMPEQLVDDLEGQWGEISARLRLLEDNMHWVEDAGCLGAITVLHDQLDVLDRLGARPQGGPPAKR